MKMTLLLWLSICSLFGAAFSCDAYIKTNQWPGRSVIVQMFEWKWLDIAEECERFLGPKGFGAVQTSPASENLILDLNGTRPWYERYQVMSNKRVTRSGNEADFLNMTTRCNKVGVRIYVDVVFNHMAIPQNTNKVYNGTGGSTALIDEYLYPAVPYRKEHFHHPVCEVNDYDNATEIRVCQLGGLQDLNQTMPYVRQRIIVYLNELIDLGVAGFRVDAAKHMWPEDLKEIYKYLSNLKTNHGFRKNSRPYIYHEVSKGGVVTYADYRDIGDVTEFTAALAFLLAHPYGQPRMTSSFYFNSFDDGPPADSEGNIISPTIDENGMCDENWVCEHRWGPVYRMVAFRNEVMNTEVNYWWDNGNNQVAFSLGDKGFIAFNTEGSEMHVEIQTGLPAGIYCDIISGEKDKELPFCTGRNISVSITGKTEIILSGAEETHLAIHVGKESLLVLTG
ncbi:alpha-amylase 4N-like isoform X2 [Helicoverpa zea]|uniref:alpha-amylase 4N-like isoform X2 n=1 Tax=Helicoverpa zea TaxID=7113 RepID=UPI001F57F836|nr:alpha-amylase 4N-like isoform X2 [Helicoverpa zea]